MAVDDEGDREGDDDGNHHPAGLQILVRTVADIRELLLGYFLYCKIIVIQNISSRYISFTRRASEAKSPGCRTC